MTATPPSPPLATRPAAPLCPAALLLLLLLLPSASASDARRRRELDATQRRSVALRITVATDVPMNRLHVPSSAARAKQRCQSR